MVLREASATRVGGSAVPDLLGGLPDQIGDRYAVASPVERVPLGVRSLCVHGRGDDVVPIAQSERWVAAAQGAGDDADLAAFDGGHFEVLDPAHESWRLVADRLERWLRPDPG